MKAIHFILLLGATIAVASGYFYFQRGGSQNNVFAESREYTIGQDVEDDWSKFCISTQYTWPNLAIPELSGTSCLRDVEVPQYESYFVYLSEKGQCSVHKAKGSFIFDSNIETRCFNRSEVENARMTLSEGNFRFGEADD